MNPAITPNTTPDTAPHSAWRRLFDERPLAAQFALLGTALAGVLGVALWWWLPSVMAAPAAMAAAAGALAMAGTSAVLARRSASGLARIQASARQLRQDDDGTPVNFAPEHSCPELQQTSQALQRLLDAQRARVRALLAAQLALAQRLQLRSHELSTLQDLSIGLASKSDLHELVDEALGALEQTVEYSSATIWSREARAPQRSQAPGEEPGQSPASSPASEPRVVLMGYRRAGDSADSARELRGQRLSKQNLAHFLTIEREREAIIVNHSRQNLLSWLWAKVTDDASSSSLYRATRAWMALPLKFRDEVLGVLRVDHHEQGYFDAERARLLHAIGSQAALAMRHARLQEQERVNAVVAERNRIARELHDAVSQTLFAAHLQAGTLATLAGASELDADSLRRQAHELERQIQGALAEMRMLMFELRPDALSKAQLSELLPHVIGALQCRGDFEVDARIAANEPLSEPQRMHVYRIAQEAIANVARHSQARHVAIEWKVDPGHAASLRIADDGQGFEPALARPGHFGLENMQSRAREMGATLTLTSAPGQGSSVLLQLGLQPELAGAASR